MRLAGKVAIISGAASGLGAATARRFAAEGAKVVVADVLDDEGREIADAIGKSGGEAVFLRLDVTNEANWTSVVDSTVVQFGKLDVAVNNAGISGSKVNDTMETDAWERLMAVNASGVFFGLKFEVPAMRRAGGGSIINISSISGNAGQPNIHLGYNASKGAVRIMTKAAAVQFGPDGIRVNSIHPGLMPPMRTSGATADPELRARWLRRVPIGRFGEVDDVANACLFLASDEASYITGSEVHVDGGYLAS
ncbi:MAG: glucose 1-dehydrogenase [Pseudomonadota bacterium]|nr:glucose 1-dehydrogenase [Pseudomonadota bacterium]